jgi:CRISPR-associated protein Cas5t
MLALRIHVPVVSWVKPAARQYRETERIPPLSTCYGFLLSLVGEESRYRHLGVRLTPALIPDDKGRLPQKTRILRLLRRLKNPNPADIQNQTPELQEIYGNLHLALWVDSAEEKQSPTLEDRVRQALERPEEIDRYGALSLGESTWAVNSIDPLDWNKLPRGTRAFLTHPHPRVSLATWVDHKDDSTTNYAHGNLEVLIANPPFDRMATISGPRPATVF